MSVENFEQYPNNKLENWIAYRESPEFLQGIKALEDLEGYSSYHKALLLAVALNLKKGASLEFPDTIDTARVEQIMSGLGIFFHRDDAWKERFSERRPGQRIPNYHMYQVGASMEDVAEVMRVDGVSEEEFSDEEYGRAMDFPETAVTAYGQYVQTGDEKLLLPLFDPRLTAEEQAFTNSRLSEANWEEEIQWREQLMAGVLEHSPKIYSDIIDDFEKHLETREKQ